MSQIVADLDQQLRVLVGELLLLEIHQLAERHPQDRVGLHGRERIFFGHAAFRLELHVPFVARAPVASIGAGVLISISALFRLGLRLRRADHADHFVDVRMRQQQPCTVCLPLAGAGEQELRPPADDGRRGAE